MLVDVVLESLRESEDSVVIVNDIEENLKKIKKWIFVFVCRIRSR